MKTLERDARISWRDEDESVRRIASRPAALPAAGGRRRVLLVDDDPELREAVAACLEPGFEVVGLSDGTELGPMLDAFEPDALILDLRLPGPDGFALCRAVRARAGFEDIPVLVLTAARDDETFLRLLRESADAYLTKPFDPRELRETLARLT